MGNEDLKKNWHIWLIVLCVDTLYMTQLEENESRESSSTFTFKKKKKSKHNTLLFFLSPALQSLAISAQAWIRILWVLQSIPISLVFQIVKWKTYKRTKEPAFTESVSKLLLQRFTSL